MPRASVSSMRVALFIAAVLSTGCMPSTEVRGTLHIQEGTGKVRSFAFADCSSGDRQQFRGVDVLSESAEAAVRIAVDPIEGPRVRLRTEHAQYIVDPRTCSTFEASVNPTGWRVNKILVVSGATELDCPLSEGGRVRGKVEYEDCH